MALPHIILPCGALASRAESDVYIIGQNQSRKRRCELPNLACLTVLLHLRVHILTQGSVPPRIFFILLHRTCCWTPGTRAQSPEPEAENQRSPPCEEWGRGQESTWSLSVAVWTPTLSTLPISLVPIVTTSLLSPSN